MTLSPRSRKVFYCVLFTKREKRFDIRFGGGQIWNALLPPERSRPKLGFLWKAILHYCFPKVTNTNRKVIFGCEIFFRTNRNCEILLKCAINISTVCCGATAGQNVKISADQLQCLQSKSSSSQISSKVISRFTKKTYNQWRHIVRILEIFVGCKNFAKNSLAIIRLVSQAFSPSLSRLPWCNGVQYCGEGVTGDFPIDASKHHHSLKMLPLLQMVGGPNKFNKIFFLSIFFIIYWVLVTWSEHGTVLLIVI